jgi:hypothetical protein
MSIGFVVMGKRKNLSVPLVANKETWSSAKIATKNSIQLALILLSVAFLEEHGSVRIAGMLPPKRKVLFYITN